MNRLYFVPTLLVFLLVAIPHAHAADAPNTPQSNNQNVSARVDQLSKRLDSLILEQQKLITNQESMIEEVKTLKIRVNKK